MLKTVTFISIVMVVMASGCKEEMVGAPCVSETDDRIFNVDLLGSEAKSDDITWSIETGSVQCETNICLTQTKRNPDADKDRRESCGAAPSPENCGAVINDGDVEEEPVLLKFSFCSCRCEDGEGNRQADNADKFEHLCECPPSAHCVKVLDPIAGIESDKLFGGYCVPECIDEPCEASGASDDGFGEVCTPSSNSEEPWLWSCKKLKQ